MSNKYTVKQTPFSELDLDEIIGHIAYDNIDVALILLEKFKLSFERLSSYPFSGSVPEDANLRIKGCSKLVVDSYVVIYLPNTNTETISIIRIFSAYMDYIDQL
jgi:plasmid stabilization system protein ParE